MSRFELHEEPRLTVMLTACGCARHSPDVDVVKPGEMVATVPIEKGSRSGWVVCLPCAALLILEWDLRGDIANAAGCPEVIAAIRAAAPPEAP